MLSADAKGALRSVNRRRSAANQTMHTQETAADAPQDIRTPPSAQAGFGVRGVSMQLHPRPASANTSRLRSPSTTFDQAHHSRLTGPRSSLSRSMSDVHDLGNPVSLLPDDSDEVMQEQINAHFDQLQDAVPDPSRQSDSLLQFDRPARQLMSPREELARNLSGIRLSSPSPGKELLRLHTASTDVSGTSWSSSTPVHPEEMAASASTASLPSRSNSVRKRRMSYSRSLSFDRAPDIEAWNSRPSTASPSSAAHVNAAASPSLSQVIFRPISSPPPVTDVPSRTVVSMSPMTTMTAIHAVEEEDTDGVIFMNRSMTPFSAGPPVPPSPSTHMRFMTNVSSYRGRVSPVSVEDVKQPERPHSAISSSALQLRRSQSANLYQRPRPVPSALTKKASSNASAMGHQRLMILSQDCSDDDGAHEDPHVKQGDPKRRCVQPASSTTADRPGSVNTRRMPHLEVHKQLLPLVEGRAGMINPISVDTVASLVRGEHHLHYDHIIIVDCRYGYEYKGGHINTALNINTKEELYRHFFHDIKRKVTGKRIAIVFHCEFSQKRGPRGSSFIRETDRREMGIENFPTVYYPELYTMKDGYRVFHQAYPELCSPAGGYTEMLHPAFTAEFCESDRAYKSAWK